MVLFNYTSKELTAKIVYYGPGLCGKTTNLQFIYDNLPSHVKKGKMLSLATKTDRTLFFDFLPIELGKIRGMKTRVQLYTVPGQVFYNSTRKLVLKGADGLVFVADSQQKMMESNAESYRNLEENLKEIGIKVEEMPLVMQFNKRDLPHLSSVEEMNTLINRHNAPFYEAVATTGIGVEDTLKAITKLVLNHLASKYNLGTAPEARGDSAEKSEAAAAVLPVPGVARRGGGASVTVASDPGEMEIERIAGVGGTPGGAEEVAPALDLELDSGPPEGEEDLRPSPSLPPPSSSPGSRSLEQEEVGAAVGDDLEMVDLGEVGGPDDPADILSDTGPTGLEASEDLSDLLEELPGEPGDESLPSLDEPVPDFSSRRVPAPAPQAREKNPPPSAPAPLRPVPEAPLGYVRGGPSPAAVERASAISPADPLGIAGARGAERPVAGAIQVGTVIPGHEHEITVPLEMSVEGRKVRLNLKMTLTLSR